MHRCLYCYEPLGPGEKDFHSGCVRKFFGTSRLPEFPYSRKDMDALAEQVIKAQTTLTGVQPKLSLHLDRHAGSRRLTIVGLWGDYIFKPQSERFDDLPENEDLTMHLAETAKIAVVPHTLIRLLDDSLGYLTRRIDRDGKGRKIPMEDLCQLTERQTEYKYASSYERVAKAIREYSCIPGLDIANFYEVVLFAWITGNNDMHLKNFSLFAPDGRHRLTPAYDLLNARIANPADRDELALTLNGKRSRIGKADFAAAMQGAGIPPNVLENLVTKYKKLKPALEAVIDRSFLRDSGKADYKRLLNDRIDSLT